MAILPPPRTESFGYFDRYITNVNHTDLVKGLEETHATTSVLIKGLSEDMLNYRYAPGKWTIKELLGHMIDTERVFAYRALRFARKDKTPLPSYDEDLFASASNAGNRTIESLLEEYYHVRYSTLALYKSFDENVLDEKGTASNSEISARAIGYVLLGHENHHVSIIKERYLNAKGV